MKSLLRARQRSIELPRLGHPSNKVLRSVLKSFQPCKTRTLPLEACRSCCINKSHHFPFGKSSIKSSRPLKIIYSDVWGPAPITSIDGFRYYIIFIDHFTKYVWLYPLRTKLDVFSTFIQYKNVVEIIFHTKIASVYTDGGGEFIKLKQLFNQKRISHLLTPPYTP